jgi:hypothetical protein
MKGTKVWRVETLLSTVSTRKTYALNLRKKDYLRNTRGHGSEVRTCRRVFFAAARLAHSDSCTCLYVAIAADPKWKRF